MISNIIMQITKIIRNKKKFKEVYLIQTLSLLIFCRVKIELSIVALALVVGVDALLFKVSGSAGDTGSDEQLDCLVRLKNKYCNILYCFN